MFRRKNNNIDDVLKRYLPKTSNKEIASARDRFLLLVKERHELQQALDNFKTPNVVTNHEYVSLGYIDQLVLTAIYLLRGEGTSLGVADKVNQLTVKKFDTGAVFLALDRLERGQLISAETRKQATESVMHFKVTAEDERMLKEVRTQAKQLMDALQDFAI